MTNDFLNNLHTKLQEDLPGKVAHSRMLRIPRISPKEAINSGKDPRYSAVLILLVPKQNQWEIVLTKRTEYDGPHSKQISFPGGKMADNDIDLLHTALRETEEEIGIPSSQINILGELTSLYIPPSNFIVQPFVGYLDTFPEFTKEEHEVEYIFTTPTLRLWEDSVIRKTSVHIERGLHIDAPYFDLNDEIVWGATAMILSEFREMYKDFRKNE